MPMQPNRLASPIGVEFLSSLAAATPMAMEAIDKTPSFAPKTKALIQLLL